MNKDMQSLKAVEQISVLELFGGIGAATKALKNLGLNVNIVDYVEIDKYAVKSYNAINGTNFEPQDIKEWDKDIKVDLIIHGSPCTNISIAGLQAGADENSGTPSSLMYETIRIVGKLKPKYVVWENVKNLLSKKHKHNFDNYINELDELGYNSYYQVLDAKDYGVPQHRERIYTISIKKDIDNGNFKFPQKQELKIRLKDILEDKVDEKYYLKDYQIENIKKSNYIQNQRRIQEKDYCDTLCARDWKDPKCIQVGELDIKGIDQIKRIYSTDGLSPTLTTMGGGNREPKILSYVDKKYNNFIEDKGYFPEMFNPYHTKEIGNIAPTQTTQCASTTSSSTICINNGTRVRKLTPLECWRLMSFDDEDFDKAEKVNSNTQLYKQAGNSIVVNVLEKIFKNLLTLS